MTYQATPSDDGVYRIKVLGDDKFIECIEDSNQWLKLASLNTSSKKQKWKLAKVSGTSNHYSITCLDNNAGLGYIRTSETYWGYGYPSPKDSASLNWVIEKRSTGGQGYSKIYLDGNDKSFFFDSNDTHSNKHAVNFYYDKSSVSDGPNQCYLFEKVPDEPTSTATPLDVVFIQDVTGSQQPYINKARDEVKNILAQLVSDGNVQKDKLRAGCVVFRDHPPQDNSLLTDTLPLSDDLGALTSYLKNQVATGGGDGPEAQSDALYEALIADWNDDTARVVILITDSPPHGTGEPGDGFPAGCPNQNDPLLIADRMGDLGITLYVVACEPEFSRYSTTFEFYSGLMRRSRGDSDTSDAQPLPLGEVDGLVDLIDQSLKQTVSAYALGQANKSFITSSSGSLSHTSKKLHEQFKSKNTQLETLYIDDYYEVSDATKRNINVWAKAKNLAEGKAKREAASGPGVKERYRGGGQPKVTLKKQAITLQQTENIVRMCKAKGRAK